MTARLGWGRDLTRGARTLARSPAFTGLSVTTLALGIGAVTAMFTVLDQVVLRPLPVRHQDGIVVVWNHHTVRDIPHYPFLWEAYRAVQEGVPSLVSVAATSSVGSTEVLARFGDEELEVLRQSAVLGDFFGVLGVAPALGRVLRPEDDARGAARVAVISHDLWMRAWGESPAEALGASITLGDEPYTVVGVLPRGFDYPRETDVWVALRASYVDQGLGELYVEADLVGRLEPGASSERVAEEIAGLYRILPELAAYRGAVPVVIPLATMVLGDLRPTLALLLCGAVLVLLMALVNVANLVEVRAARREEWVAVKRALGASRGRLARESLSEAAWLGALGGAGGALVAAAAIRFLVPATPPGLARLDDVGPPDALALLVTATVTGGIVLLLAVLPVARAARVDPAASLRGGGGPGTAGRARRRGGGRGGIVVAQAALAVWCAAAGVLLTRSLLNLQALDPGFEVDDLLIVDLVVPYPFGQLPEDHADRLDRVARRVEADPAVLAVTPALSPPLVGDRGWLFVPRLEGQSGEEATENNPMANWEVVQPDYFETLELPIHRGRAFTAADAGGAPRVVVVNEAAARLLWPAGDALGRTLGAFGGDTGDAEWTVVGVAGDTRYQDFVETRPVVYFPLRQLTTFPLSHLLVRVAGATEGLLPRIRDAWAEEDPAVRVKGASSLRARLDAPLARPRFAALILGTLAATTLLLAAVGVYGVMAAAVRARTAEVGVRKACGATSADVRALLLGSGLLLAGTGAVLGALAVLAGGALIESLLFGVTPSDPWSLAIGVMLVLAAALAACVVPAERAARLDPARVLRAE